MKLTNDQFEEAAFIFERENGYSHSDYEKEVIAGSDLTAYQPAELELMIITGLNNGIYIEEFDRVSAYWSLSKIGKPELIQNFRRWLQEEFKKNNTIPVYQILVALDRLEEPVFHSERTGTAADETDLNMRDAKNYLDKKTVHNNI